MMNIEVLVHTDLGEKVHEILRNRLLVGAIPPGTPLNIVQVARQLGVSRSPVNDAVIRLVAEGLVEDIPRKGYVVARFTAKAYAELLECRLAIELAAADYAVHRASDTDVGFVRDAVTALERSVNDRGEREGHLEWITRDDKIHYSVVDCAKNPFLSEVHRRLKARSHLARHSPGMKTEYLPIDEVLQQHRAIYHALEDRDLGSLRAAITQHIRAVEEFYCGLGVFDKPQERGG